MKISLLFLSAFIISELAQSQPIVSVTAADAKVRPAGTIVTDIGSIKEVKAVTTVAKPTTTTDKPAFTVDKRAIVALINLSAFNALQVSQSVRVNLTWITDAEKNISHYEIEKSLDGKNFTEAGIVFAYGNTTGKMNYQFPDNILPTQSTKLYYRIKTVGDDGRAEYSAVQTIAATAAK